MEQYLCSTETVGYLRHAVGVLSYSIIRKSSYSDSGNMTHASLFRK